MQGAINTLGVTFDYARMPENADLLTATSHITKETINRFCHVHQNKEDLHKKQDMTRFLCQKAGGCIQRCMGIDAANAISCVSHEAEKGKNSATEYYKRPGGVLRPDGREGQQTSKAQPAKGPRCLRPRGGAEGRWYCGPGLQDSQLRGRPVG